MDDHCDLKRIASSCLGLESTVIEGDSLYENPAMGRIGRDAVVSRMYRALRTGLRKITI